jgi:hypothetical protein
MTTKTENTTATVEVLPTLEMSEVPQDFQVKIRASFGELMQQAETLVDMAREISAMDESPEQEAAARVTRLALVKVRTGADKIHKDMKQGILVQGRAIDGAKNIVIAATSPSEKDMQAIEDRAEMRAEEERKKLHEQRFAELNQYTTAYNTLSLGRLSAEEYAGLLDDAQLAHEARISREKKAEEDRIAAEKAAEDERKRIEAERIEKARKEAKERAELEKKLKAEQAERERIEAEAKAEREKAAAEQKRKDAEAAKALAAEKAKADAERANLEAQLKAQREKAEAAERAAKAESDRLAKIEADRIAAEQAVKDAAEAEAKKAALAPDKQKIAAYAIALSAIDIPAGTTVAGKKALAQVGTVIDAALAEIRTIYTALK